MEEVSVSIVILDRTYKLRVKKQDEEILYAAAEMINSQIRDFSKLQPSRDRQDLIAMAAIAQMTQLIKIQNITEAQDSELIKKLNKINKLLDDANID